ncbi:MAG: FeoB-associated Cys-rich membrane protein [Fluviicola sp.]|nr:FeoB-associated Cys-rich membrane protein [Fluviicola sp.]
MQRIIVIGIIVGAAVYLGWKFYKKFSKKDKGCDKCG